MSKFDHIQLLYEFIVKEWALFSYLEIVGSFENRKDGNPKYHLSYFDWSCTKEGTKYWMNLHIKWMQVYKYKRYTQLKPPKI